MWKVGDRAVILNSYPERIGMVVTIMSELRVCRSHVVYGFGAMVHDVNLPPYGNCEWPYASYIPSDLGPIPDDYTRFHEALIASQWSDCEYNPMVTVDLEGQVQP